MTTGPKSDFEDLEKRLAKDALEIALQNLHKEIIRDIEENKATFSLEIQKTLSSFKKNLEQNVSEEINIKLSDLFDKHFRNTSSKIASNFYESFSPILQQAKEDIQQLHNQGENTLHYWREMMAHYKSIWTKPFVVAFLASVLTGMILSLISSYFLGRSKYELIQNYENRLSSCEKSLSGYISELTSTLERKNKLTPNEKNKAQGKKKK